jgi:hypothetical protein
VIGKYRNFSKLDFKEMSLKTAFHSKGQREEAKQNRFQILSA